MSSFFLKQLSIDALRSLGRFNNLAQSREVPVFTYPSFADCCDCKSSPFRILKLLMTSAIQFPCALSLTTVFIFPLFEGSSHLMKLFLYVCRSAKAVYFKHLEIKRICISF